VLILAYKVLCHYTGEMTVSDEILKRSADSYRRIRNTMRFILANLWAHHIAKRFRHFLTVFINREAVC
jgi:isoleucyl-tRNA synthetase